MFANALEGHTRGDGGRRRNAIGRRGRDDGRGSSSKAFERAGRVGRGIAEAASGARTGMRSDPLRLIICRRCSNRPAARAAGYRSWRPRIQRCCGQPASTICRAPGCFTRGAPISVARARSAGRRSLLRSSRGSSVRIGDRVRARPPVRRGLICGSMPLVSDAGPDDASVPTSHRRRGAGGLGTTPARSPELAERPKARPSQRCSHLPRAFRDCSPF